MDNEGEYAQTVEFAYECFILALERADRDFWSDRTQSLPQQFARAVAHVRRSGRGLGWLDFVVIAAGAEIAGRCGASIATELRPLLYAEAVAAYQHH